MIESNVSDYSQQLQKLGIEHEVVEHPDLRTPDEVVEYLHLTIDDSLPTLIMKADDSFIAVIRQGGTKLDFEKIKKILHVSNLRMATHDEFTSVTGLPVGAARVYNPNIQTIIDTKVFEKEYLVGGSGSFTCSIKYKTKDLRKIPYSKILDISQETQESLGGKRVYSGIRATGRLHLGNYLGAIKGMLALQNEYECIFSVVDLHSLTTPYNKETLQQSIRDIILDYLAAGLDPEKCFLEIQSQTPHAELSYLLSTVYPLAPLEDLPTFKEKKAQHPKHVNVALLYYPILMAADVLLYKAELVPVGIDQEPHLEVMREIARKFNAIYGQTFPEPRRFKTMGEYVPSLLGKGKMGKSIDGSFINLSDDLETIKKKLAKVPTDSGTTGGEVPKEGGVASLFTLLALFNNNDMHKKFKQDYTEGKIRYGDMKTYIAGAIFQELQPMQEKRKYFENHPELVNEILEKSREGCLKIANETLREVKEKMGLI